MEYNVEVTSPTQRKISVNASVQDVNSQMAKTVRAFGSGLSLDGFRKGKVPASIIEKRFSGEILSRTGEELVNGEISRILQAENLQPVSRLNLDAGQLIKGEEYKFSFSFDVLPEIELPADLGALSVEVESDQMSEEEKEEMLQQVRRSLARLEPVSEERTAAYGDVVNVDVDAEYEGKEVPGLKVSNYSMLLQEPGPDSKNKEIDAVILTLKVGESGQGSLVCPEEYPDPELRGKDIAFTVKLNSLNQQILPELNEDLAKQVGFSDIEQLKSMVLLQAQSSKSREVKAKAQDRLLESCLDQLSFPLPESMVELYRNDFLGETRNNLLRQGVAADAINSALDKVQDEAEIQAKARAKAQAFLMTLARRENISVSDDDLNRQIVQIAQQTRQEATQVAEMLYRNGMIDDLRDRIQASKALEYMFAQAQKSTPAQADATQA